MPKHKFETPTSSAANRLRFLLRRWWPALAVAAMAVVMLASTPSSSIVAYITSGVLVATILVSAVAVATRPRERGGPKIVLIAVAVVVAIAMASVLLGVPISDGFLVTRGW